MDSNWSQVELTNIMKHSIAHYCRNCEKRVLHTIIENISKQNSKNVVYIRKTINTYLKTLNIFNIVRRAVRWNLINEEAGQFLVKKTLYVFSKIYILQKTLI
jgi:hypothetical protein